MPRKIVSYDFQDDPSLPENQKEIEEEEDQFQGYDDQPYEAFIPSIDDSDDVWYDANECGGPNRFSTRGGGNTGKGAGKKGTKGKGKGPGGVGSDSSYGSSDTSSDGDSSNSDSDGDIPNLGAQDDGQSPPSSGEALLRRARESNLSRRRRRGPFPHFHRVRTVRKQQDHEGFYGLCCTYCQTAIIGLLTCLIGISITLVGFLKAVGDWTDGVYLRRP